jgi:hypothetical protein
MQMFALLFFLSISFVAKTQVNPFNFSAFQGWANLRACAQDCIDEIGIGVGCGTSQCICGDEAVGLNYIKSCAMLVCESDSAEVSSATSFFDAYCSNYLAVSAITTPAAATTTGRNSNGNGSPLATIVTATVFITPTGFSNRNDH